MKPEWSTQKLVLFMQEGFFSLSLPTVSGGSWHFKIVNNHNAPHIVPELIHSRKQNVDIFMLRKYRSASQIESADHQNSSSNCYHNIFSILLDIFILFISHSLYTGCIFQLEGRNLEPSVYRRKRFFFLNIVSKGQWLKGLKYCNSLI